MSVPPSLDLPAGTRRADVDLPSGAVAVVEVCPEKVRGTALLVPGFTGSKEDFAAVLGPLSEAGWRVVAMDQRGQFETPGPTAPGDCSLHALAADVVALASLLCPDGERLHLVGHSLGGLVARAAVIESPASWRTLTLMASGPAAIPADRREPFALLRSVLPAATMAQVWDAKEARDRAAGVPQPPAAMQAFLHRRWVATDPASMLAMAEILCDEPDRVDDLAAAVADAEVPVTVLFGEHDDAWPPALQHDMAVRLGAKVVVLPGVGHSPAAESPGATSAALDAHWSQVS